MPSPFWHFLIQSILSELRRFRRDLCTHFARPECLEFQPLYTCSAPGHLFVLYSWTIPGARLASVEVWLTILKFQKSRSSSSSRSSNTRGGHGSVYISKVSHFTFVWLVSKNLGHGWFRTYLRFALAEFSSICQHFTFSWSVSNCYELKKIIFM